MAEFILTVFEKNGEKLMEEKIKADDVQEAKRKGEDLLVEKGYENHTSRLTSSKGELVLFHR